jgi:hypothetical protein
MSWSLPGHCFIFFPEKMDALIFRPERSRPAEKRDAKALEEQTKARLTALAEFYNFGMATADLTTREIVLSVIGNVFLVLYLIWFLIVTGLGWTWVWTQFPACPTCDYLCLSTFWVYVGIGLAFATKMSNVFWAHWVIRKDHRFSGAPLDAPTIERVKSLWANTHRQMLTDCLLSMREGHLFRPTLDAKALCAAVPKELADILEGGDPAFLASTQEEKVNALAQRVLYVVLSH